MKTVICVFPIIKDALDNGMISIDTIADTLDESESYVTKRLSGLDNFDINEAMAINNYFFPEIPFKTLFSKNT